MVQEITLPDTKGIRTALDKVDFKDAYATTNHSNNLEEIAKMIFDQNPRWLQTLFKIRGFFGVYLGLKKHAPADYKDDFKVGGHVKFFKIYSIDPNEIILGANDNHLNFRVSIYNAGTLKNNIQLSTLVKYHNRTGKIYMQLIAPFHRMVIRYMLQRATQN
ncbi:MAG: DUF2867 domain-containing protein [Flavobacteriaceae bacterium]|nr:DUF2867 domain-containing protein [Flavobacteriaceae bacterium]